MYNITKKGIIIGVASFVLGLGMIFLAMWGIPKYNVWQKELAGRAELAQASYNKQILIREAEARLEAEVLNAKAEVARAKGMAEAMEIEGGTLTETYIKYLWVRELNNTCNNIIYVPTEAGLPLLEARPR